MMMTKKIIATALIGIMTLTSNIGLVNAGAVPGVQTLNSGSQLTVPTYNDQWGLNFPQTIGKITSFAETKDVFALDFKISDRNVDKKARGLFSGLVFIGNIIEMKYPGWKTHDKGKDLAPTYKKVYDQEIYDILDRDGKQVQKDQYGEPIMSSSYYESLNPGDVMFTVLFKNTGDMAKNFKVKSELYWDKVKSSVIQPDVTGKVSHSFTSGVSNTEAYSFAKTIGSSKGISIGGQLKAGSGSANGGALTVNYTYTMSESITRSFSRSTTISSQENTAVDYTYKNEKDHPIGIAIYRPVEVFSIDQTNSNGAFYNLNNYAKKSEMWTLAIPEAFVYNHSDFISITSN